MESKIDPTKPQTGLDQPVKVIRDNFAFAKTELDALLAMAEMFGLYENPTSDSSGRNRYTIPRLPSIPVYSPSEFQAIPTSLLNVGSVCIVSSPTNALHYYNGWAWVKI